MACAKDPLTPPDRDLDAGEVERLWKTDRAALSKVNGCLHRLVCQSLEANRDLAQRDGVVCSDAPPAAPAKRGFLRKRFSAS